MVWTPQLIQPFEDLKHCVTSSPVLARFDPNKPTILKTDWSSKGKSWILMKPSDDEISVKATETFCTTGELKFTFDSEMNGPWLWPVWYGSRACLECERWFHSFIGEVAAGRWAIGQNRKFLWGILFYSLCDCSVVKDILEYNGSILMIKRWAQELLGYQFLGVHQHEKFMRDVDSLNRFYEPDFIISPLFTSWN